MNVQSGDLPWSVYFSVIAVTYDPLDMVGVFEVLHH